MKKTIVALLAVVSISSVFAQSLEMEIRRKIDRLAQAGDDRAIARLSRVEKDEMNSLMTRALQVLRDDGRDGLPDDRRDRPGPGPGPGPRDWRRNSSWERNQVIAYSDFSCRTQVTALRGNDDCARLGTIYATQYVGSVNLNGECQQVTMQSFRNSCQNLVNLAAEQKPRTTDMVLFSDFSCRTKVIDIDTGTSCAPLTAVLGSKYIGSVQLAGGVCTQITMRAFNNNNCTALQDAVLAGYENDGRRRRSESIEMFSDFSCRTPVTTIQRGDNCQALNALYDNKYVGSINFRGQCVQQQMKSFLNACNELSR